MRRLNRAAAAAVLLMLLSGCGERSSGTIDKTIFAMDTAVSFRGSEEDFVRAEEILTRLDLLFDRYSEDSDVYAVNSRQSSDISEETREIILEACALSEKYGGDVNIFAGAVTDCWKINSENPSVPSDEELEKALLSTGKASFSLETMSFADENGSLDLGSVGKGYALDKIRSELGEDSFYIVSANSSILLNGEKPDGEKFTVSIRDPETGEGTLGTIRTDACFVSTSGGYERFFEADGKRYSHIFDLGTGCPAETDLTSVTVICDSGIESDFLSTLIYIGGTSRLGEFLDSGDVKIAAVTENGEIYLSDGLEFELSPDCGYQVIRSS